MAGQIQLKTFELMQYLDADNWLWSDEEKQKYFTGDIDSAAIMKRLCYRMRVGLETLKNNGAKGIDLDFEFCGIEHDKDMDNVWDEKISDYILEPIPPHLHCVFTLSTKRDVNVLAQILGVKPQFLSAPKKGRYGKENMLAYLVHAKAPDKYQYNPEEVQTFGTFDYMAFWRGKKSAWDRRAAEVQVKENKVSAHWLVKRVQRGELSKRDIMRNKEYREIYADNMPIINDAILYYGEMKGYETLDALENGEFELSVLFVTGAPGSGKTHFALEQVKILEETHGWRSYQASPTNPMDDYNGEEIVILDDLRAQSLDATNWLQMLDARTMAGMSARYKNKRKAYRTLIITSYLEPYEFFSYVKGTGGANEALDQFIRRIMLNIRVHRLRDDGRLVEVEAIGMTPEVIYDIHNKGFIKPDKETATYKNGLPIIDEDKQYDARMLAMTDNDINYKKLNFASFPLFSGSLEESGKHIRDIITSKNNPDINHLETERPKVGDAAAYIKDAKECEVIPAEVPKNEDQQQPDNRNDDKDFSEFC